MAARHYNTILFIYSGIIVCEGLLYVSMARFFLFILELLSVKDGNTTAQHDLFYLSQNYCL